MTIFESFLATGKNHKSIQPSHYFKVYEEILSPLKSNHPRILEIGVRGGGFLAALKHYYDSKCILVGIDIDASILNLGLSEDINLEVGSQSDLSLLERVNSRFGPFDVIFDDGSHLLRDIKISFNFLYPRMTSNGVYVIADTNAAFMIAFDGLPWHTNVVKWASRKLVILNKSKLPNAAIRFKTLTRSISFHDSLIIFKRGQEVSLGTYDSSSGSIMPVQPNPGLKEYLIMRLRPGFKDFLKRVIYFVRIKRD